MLQLWQSSQLFSVLTVPAVAVADLPPPPPPPLAVAPLPSAPVISTAPAGPSATTPVPTLDTRHHGPDRPPRDSLDREPSLKSPARLFSTTIFVSRLPTAQLETIGDYCKKFGKVASAQYVPEKGHVFVRFATRDGAEAAKQALENRQQRCYVGWARGMEFPPRTPFDIKTGEIFPDAPTMPHRIERARTHSPPLPVKRAKSASPHRSRPSRDSPRRSPARHRSPHRPSPRSKSRSPRRK